MEPADIALEQLVARARRGDRDAFDDLAAQFGQRLETVVRFRLPRSVRQRVDVDDVLQETWIRAVRGVAELEWRGRSHFVAWLTKIAENTCRDVVRQHLISEKSSVAKEVSLAQAVGGDSGNAVLADFLSGGITRASQALRREERFERLQSALEMLSPEHQEVLILSLIQRVPTAEIGARLGLSSGAVCMLRSRALKKLRQVFGDTDSLRLPDLPIAPEDGASA